MLVGKTRFSDSKMRADLKDHRLVRAQRDDGSHMYGAAWWR
jgi:hypothetical protein